MGKIDCAIVGQLEERLADHPPLIPGPLEGMDLNDGGDAFEARKDRKNRRSDGMNMNDVEATVLEGVSHGMKTDGELVERLRVDGRNSPDLHASVKTVGRPIVPAGVNDHFMAFGDQPGTYFLGELLYSAADRDPLNGDIGYAHFHETVCSSGALHTRRA
jgi:hypothetical protein